MKITVGPEFAERFAAAALAVPTRTPSEILRYVRLEASLDGFITLESSDGETGVLVDAKGSVERPGVVLLPRDRVGNILREASFSQMVVEADGDQVTLVYGGARFQLPTARADEFPRPKFESLEGVEVSFELLKGALHRTVFATDTSSARFALGAILLEIGGGKVRAIATDGRRLSTTEIACQESESLPPLLVPKSFAELIGKMQLTGTVLLSGNANQFLVHGDGISLVTRLVEGRFPNWQAVLPNVVDHLSLFSNARSLTGLIRQAQITQDQETRGLTFVASEGKLTAGASTKDAGASTIDIPVEFNGPSVTVRLDSRFLLEYLKRIDDDARVQIYLLDANRAVLVVPVLEGSDSKYVCMPMAME